MVEEGGRGDTATTVCLEDAVVVLSPIDCLAEAGRKHKQKYGG